MYVCIICIDRKLVTHAYEHTLDRQTSNTELVFTRYLKKIVMIHQSLSICRYLQLTSKGDLTIIITFIIIITVVIITSITLILITIIINIVIITIIIINYYFMVIAGLVKELDIHKYEYATKFLTTHTTYILVEKQSLAPEEQEAGTDSSSNPSTPTPPQVQYIPLLDDDTCRDQFPNFKLHVRHVEKKRKTRTMSKSPSPAGRKVKKSTAHARSSSRKK